MRFSQVCSLLLSITTIASTMVFQPVLAQSEQLDILRHDRGDGKSSVTIQNGEKIDVYLTSPSSNTTWLIPSSSKLSCVKDSDKPNEKVTCTASNLETTYHRVYIRALINNVSTNSVDIVVAGNQNQTSQSTQTTVAPASGPRVYNFKQYLSQTGQTAAQF
ncbi:MAG: hypothetical protein Q8P95_04290, partial [bacterium]|nr:hypothetical protein [bacterium]